SFNGDRALKKILANPFIEKLLPIAAPRRIGARPRRHLPLTLSIGKAGDVYLGLSGFVRSVSYPAIIGRHAIAADVGFRGRRLHKRDRLGLARGGYDPERNVLLTIAEKIGDELPVR